jgi:hypothetical protein
LQIKIYDTLIKLPFIKESNAYIDSVSNHKHGIAFLMDSSDIKDEVIVTAGFNDTDMFKTHYTIYVNAKSLDIKVWDGVSGRKLSIAQFEKKNK